MADHQFPQDVLYIIFSRLPVKSLARFRCVCKQWLKLINDPYLHTIHIKEEPTPIIFQQFQSVHHNNITKECRISFLRVIQGTTNAQKEPLFKFYYKSWGFLTRQQLVVGSCNGLTLVCYEKAPSDHRDSFGVINLLTKQRHNLPPIKHLRSCKFYCRFDVIEAAGIGFDDSTNTLKTVFVILKEKVLSQDIDVDLVPKILCTMVHDSGMSSWREIPKTPAYPITGAGVYANGRLHWLINFRFYRLLPNVNDRRKVVWFDVKMEEFGLTDQPPKPRRDHWTDHQLVDLNGEVGYAYVGICMELWVLKEEGWVLHCRFDPNVALYDVAVLGFWNKDGDILFTGAGGKLLFVYKVKTGDLLQIDHGVDIREAHIQMFQNSLFAIDPWYQHKWL